MKGDESLFYWVVIFGFLVRIVCVVFYQVNRKGERGRFVFFLEVGWCFGIFILDFKFFWMEFKGEVIYFEVCYIENSVFILV